MIPFLHTFLIFLIVIFQVSFLSQFSFLQATPNLLLVIIISWSVLKDYKNSFIWALGGGILLDLFSDNYFGFYTISLLLIVLLVYYLVSRFINIDNIYSRIGIISIATLISNLSLALFFLILSFLKLEYTEYLKSLWPLILGEMILNIIFIILFYNLVKKLQEFVLHYKERIKVKT